MFRYKQRFYLYRRPLGTYGIETSFLFLRGPTTPSGAFDPSESSTPPLSERLGASSQNTQIKPPANMGFVIHLSQSHEVRLLHPDGTWHA